ncbi:MAG: Uncharacterized protein G01um101413_480 [Parcubacteria group bacterium Gr01-1014_13]|nr:MAG: Uncharacterized protein G01um101413_480 [Parcubacteria group bacterium Gr01-1014_13]
MNDHLINGFEHNLIKGKIAETIFELMFQESKKFSVFHFGYEYTAEYLAQYNLALPKEVLSNIRHSPDFIIVTENKKGAYLVEVKYRTHIDNQEMIDTARRLKERWNPSYIFVISNDGFYFTPANTIINKGKMEKLDRKWINSGLQTKYFKLVEDYLCHHKDKNL